MNLHQLRLFCAVVEKGTFSIASRDLFISQPALSIQIKRLEQSLGVVLLQRTRTGVRPTPDGRDLYASARSIVEQASAAERRLRALRDGEAGSLMIGVSHTGALYFLTAMIKELAHQHPAMSVDVDLQIRPRMLERISTGALDAGIEWGLTVPPDLEAIPLSEIQFGVVASPEHVAASTGVLTPEEFVQTRLFLVQEGLPSPLFPDVWLMERNLLPTVVSHQPSTDVAKRLAEANLGLAILSRIAVERELQAGHLVWLDLEGLELRRHLVLIAPRRSRPPLLEHFIAFACAFSAG